MEIAPTGPTDWRAYHCRIRHANGTESWVALLRPAAWVQNAKVLKDGSAVIWLDLPEGDICGWAVIEKILECPVIRPGRGRVVTGLFHHSCSYRMLTMRIEVQSGTEHPRLGEPIRVTDAHPFWSVDRNQWVPAGRLKVGEKLHSLTNQSVVVAGIYRGEAEPTYNLEVEYEHVYRV